ncbi:MAG: 4Fe-4S dicluster domain-containing protein [Defluviitaleaceae bacterium]|nr:4Fe-4S dicluster domain-containing protein [Defluviitaleaceae bacterium]
MIITKADMKKVLAGILKDSQYRLAAPASNGKKIDFLEVADVSHVIMDDRIAYKSPKEFFFPRCEKLFSFSDDGAVISEQEKPCIIFGVKPCDLEALDVMSKIFMQGKFTDPFFASHLERNLIIGVGCQEKKKGCFCDLLSVDMSYSNKCDLFLENSHDDYIVRYVSDKGRDKLSAFTPGLAAFKNTEYTPPNNPALSLPQGETAYFDQTNINWDELMETCQACGLCSFICPTCHCFDFKDVEQNDVSCRYRIWDSCMYSKFTLHASGHNPRDTKTERYRQRVMHKFSYVPNNVGTSACTGCGRCIRSCPAGVNIRQIAAHLMEVKA